MKTVAITIKVGKKGTPEYREIPDSYSAPESDQEFQKLIAGLKDKELTLAHANYIRGLDLHTRATNTDAQNLRVGPVTYVMKDSKGMEIDLRTLPLARLIAGINSEYNGFRKPSAPIKNTRAWLLAEGKVVEKDGVLVAKGK